MGAQRITRISIIAALYAGCTLVAMLFLGWMSWGVVQFRISEAVTILALFTADAIAGLTLGCIVANLGNMAFTGMGAMGLLDVVFGALATALGSWFSWKFRDRPALAVAGPVISNALIIPTYLPLIMRGMGFYTIPFTSIALDSNYLAMYLFGVVSVGLGEAAVMYLLGLPTYRALCKTSFPERFQQGQGEDVAL